MAAVFIEGFDKYGAPSGTNSAVQAALLANEWTSIANGMVVSIVAALSSSGYALHLNGAQSYALVKNLPSNYSRLIGGVRFASDLTVNGAGFAFLDGTNFQCSVFVNQTTGTISFRSGSSTTLATTSVSVSANSIHYLEWDITFGSSANYQVWLDGVSVLSGTGNTRAGSSNNYANAFDIDNSSNLTIDDLYLFDSTTATNNAVLNTNPRIETQFPNADSSVQFSFGAAVLGQPYSAAPNTAAPGANELILRPFNAGPGGVLGSISCIPQTTSGTANFKSVVYADSSGPTGSPLATGNQVTGTLAGTTLTSAFASPPTLSASTVYWLGFITDTNIAFSLTDLNDLGYSKSNTYSSGAPTSPSMTGAQASWLIYGNYTSGTGVNYYEVDIDPPPGDLSYVADGNVGDQDLYDFPNLTTTPTAVYAVAVKGLIRVTPSGARAIDLRMHSGSTTSSGSNVGQSPATTYGWLDSFFVTDPNTGSAWSVAGLNAATSGAKITG
jgi:hypothetical protein